MHTANTKKKKKKNQSRKNGKVFLVVENLVLQLDILL